MKCTKCGKEFSEGMFCPECGTRVDETVSSAQNSGDQYNTEFDENSIKNIVGKNVSYYEKEFEKIRKTGKCKMNWASFFLGFLHAGYRNVWKEWLFTVGKPYIVAIIAAILSAVLFPIQNILGLLCIGVACLASVGIVIAQIMFAKKFNITYWKHVSRKVDDKTEKQDASIIRGIICCILLSVAMGGLEAAVSMSIAGIMLNSLISDTDEEFGVDDNQDTVLESEEDNNASDQEPMVQAEDAVYGSYRMDLNNEDNGWCEANVRAEDGNIFLDVAGYIYGDQDVADLSGQLERQENGTYTVSNLYLYDGELYLGEDAPENVSVDVVFADACMTVQIANVDGATVSQLSGTYELLSNDGVSGEEIQRVEEYVYWDDMIEVDVSLEYTGENEGNAIWNETDFDENNEVTSEITQKAIFSLIDESGIYGLTYPDTGEMDSLVFTITTESDGAETYKCMHLIDDSENINLELPDKEYAYSHFS